MKDLEAYGQYKNDFWNKLDFDFVPGRTLLDVGCGDGSDLVILEKEYGLDVCGMDVYRDEKIDSLGLRFTPGSALDIPFESFTFDYVFTHDVLHHVDEMQRRASYVKALEEMKRVTNPGGTVIIVEGNRYNPLFYPHMVKMLGHEHLRQRLFVEVVREVFGEDAQFSFFEAHLYPARLVRAFKVYERLMERLAPRSILAYNAAVAPVPG